MIKTVTLTGEEIRVDGLKGTNMSLRNIAIRNDGGSPIYVSALPNIVEGADNVLMIPAGGSAVYCNCADTLYFLGEGSAVCEAISNGFNPFERSSAGGGSGTDNYAALLGLPQINGVTLLNNKTSEDLHLADADDVVTPDGKTILADENNTISARTPVPASGCPIHIEDSAAGEVAVTGWVKNLFDKSGSPVSTYVSVDETATGIKITSNGSTAWRGAGYYIAVPPHTDLTISCVVMSEDPDLCLMEIKQSDKTHFTVKKQITGNGRKSLTFNTENNGYIWISFYGNTSVLKPNTITFDDFMLEKGSVAHPYVPYSGYDITSCGKNLIPYPYDLESGHDSVSGLDITVNDDCSVTLNGATISADTTHLRFCYRKKIDFAGQTITLSGCPEENENYMLGLGFMDTDFQTINYCESGAPISLTVPDNAVYMMVFVQLKTIGYTFNNVTFKPMIELGETATAYEPYHSSTIHVTNDTPAPVYGLKLFDGATNIFNDYGADVSIIYGNEEVGRSTINALSQHDNAISGKADKFAGCKTDSFIHIEDSAAGEIAVTDWVKNLIPFPYDTVSRSGNGWSIDVLPEGGIRINGTFPSTQWFHFWLNAENVLLPERIYTLSGDHNAQFELRFKGYREIGNEAAAWYSHVDTGNGVQVVIPSDVKQLIMMVTIWAGTYDNIIVAPMLEYGDTAHPYVPYEGYDITSFGRNLIPCPYYSGAHWVHRGVTYDNDNGKIIIRAGSTCSGGTSTYFYFYDREASLFNAGDVVTLSCKNIPSACSVALAYTNNDVIAISSAHPSKTFVFPENTIMCSIFLRVPNGTVITEDIVIEPPMLEYGETAHDYEPYQYSTVHITNDMPTPVYGLKSFEGVTNVFNDYGAEMSVTYPLNDDGEVLLGTLANHELGKADKFVDSDSGDFVHLEDTLDGNIAVTDWVKNLILYPYAQNSGTAGGISFNVNEDKTVTVSGSTAEIAEFFNFTFNLRLPAGTYTVPAITDTFIGVSLVVEPKSPSVKPAVYVSYIPATFTLEEETNVKVYMRITPNRTIPGVTIAPMLERGGTAHSYVPGTGYDIRSCGKNLIPYPYDLESGHDSVSGLDITVNDDCSVTLNGATISANTTHLRFCYRKKIDFAGQTITLSGCPEENENYMLGLGFMDTDFQTINYCESGAPISLTVPDNAVYMMVFVQLKTIGYTFNNVTFKPMIELGETATAYEPYHSSTIHVTNDTPAPVYGLKSFNGVTNIFADCGAELSVTYPINESGKLIIDTAKNVYDEIAQMSAAIAEIAANT